MFGSVLNTPLRCQDYYSLYPAKIYLFKVNNRNTRKRCEICLKLTIKTPFFAVFLLLVLYK